MERLRTPFFLVAAGALALVVLVEVGATYLVGGGRANAAGVADQAARLGVSMPAAGTGLPSASPPGLAIGYLALLDGLLLVVVVLMGLGLVIPGRLEGRVQPAATLMASIVIIVCAVVALVAAIGRLVTMVTLFLAFPFGTIAYLIGWGSFPRSAAALTLSLLLVLKLGFAGALVLAQQRFLANRGLVALVLTSMVCDLVVSVLHAVVPGVLVSVTDAVAGIVVAVVAIIWAVVLAIGAVPAIVNAVRAARGVVPAAG
jgi:hypothetical protein